MKIKFQLKLLLAFVALIIMIIVPLLYLVNAKISEVSEANVEKSLRISQGVFERNEGFRRQAAESMAASFLSGQASVRATLGSMPSAGTDLFGDSASQQSTAASLKNTNEVLYSSIENFDLYQTSPIFLFTDSKGILLLSKAFPKVLGEDLSGIPVIREALLGNGAISYWGSQDSSLESKPLFPKTDQPVLYEVFANPLVFGDSSVKGVMLVGLPIQAGDIQEIKNISQSDVSFVSNGTVYGTSHELKTDIKTLIAKPGTQLLHFSEGPEEFIGLVSHLGEKGGAETASLIFKSKTQELLVYNGLKKVINVIGGIAALMALLLAVLLSSEVSKAVGILMKAAKEIGLGNLNYPVHINTRDEFADLGEAFNKMSEGLREKEKIKKTFKKYVNPRVVNALLEDERKLKLGGDKRDLVIFFSDVAGFTKISEALSPEGTIDFLNQYLSEMAKLIEENEGVVDKYIGDAIMAYWIDLSSKKKNSALACATALRQQKVLEQLRGKWRDNPALQAVEVRIGIHSGDVVIGNIGSEERMEYTIIGDNVNTASRLESINKFYGTSVIVSESIAAEVADKFILRELDLIKVVGKTKPVKIFELLNTAESADQGSILKSRLFSQALPFYRAGDFSKAQEIFRQMNEGDGPSQVYIERCETLKLNPPAVWDGIFEAKSK